MVEHLSIMFPSDISSLKNKQQRYKLKTNERFPQKHLSKIEVFLFKLKDLLPVRTVENVAHNYVTVADGKRNPI